MSTDGTFSDVNEDSQDSGLRSTYLLLAAIVAAILLLFWNALERMAVIAWTDDDYSHGLILPLVVVYIYRDRAENLKARLLQSAGNKSFRDLLFPAILLLGSLSVHFLGELSQLQYASWIALFPTVFATFWLLFGIKTAFALSTPFFLLFMAKPLPDSIILKVFWPMQVLAAKVSAFSLRMFDVPVYLQGNIIEIPSMRLLVEQACSGMRSAVSLLSLAVIANYFTVFRFSYKVILVLAALLIALVMNVLRVAATGLLAHFVHPDTAKGFFHSFSGLIVFVVAMPVLLYVGKVLSRLQGEAPTKASK